MQINMQKAQGPVAPCTPSTARLFRMAALVGTILAPRGQSHRGWRRNVGQYRRRDRNLYVRNDVRLWSPMSGGGILLVCCSSIWTTMVP